MKKFLVIAFFAILFSTVYAQDNTSRNFYGNQPQSGIQVDAPGDVKFEELFNGDNTPTGIAARGWTWINNDNGGTSTCFSGNTTVFSAYEGPAEGYIGQNYQGANGLLIDQWVITPQINVSAGDTLYFWYRSTDPGATIWDDSIYVRLAPGGGNTIPDFTVNLGRYRVPNGPWTKWSHVFTISGTIRVAVQYYITNGGTSGTYSDYWGMDLFRVIEGNVVPVELVSFNANASDRNVELSWITATEVNNRGFEVQRMVGEEFETVAFVDGHGSTTETKNYFYTDKNLTPGSYSYRLKQVDFDGSFEYSKVVEADVVAPAEFSLAQNYPNPFNPSTMINFALKVDSKVTLKVFNLLGQEVATLLNQNFTAGPQSFDFNAAGLNSGVYFYQIDAQGIDGTNFTATKKMILTK